MKEYNPDNSRIIKISESDIILFPQMAQPQDPFLSHGTKIQHKAITLEDSAICSSLSATLHVQENGLPTLKQVYMLKKKKKNYESKLQKKESGELSFSYVLLITSTQPFFQVVPLSFISLD